MVLYMPKPGAQTFFRRQYCRGKWWHGSVCPYYRRCHRSHEPQLLLSTVSRRFSVAAFPYVLRSPTLPARTRFLPRSSICGLRTSRRTAKPNTNRARGAEMQASSQREAQYILFCFLSSILSIPRYQSEQSHTHSYAVFHLRQNERLRRIRSFGIQLYSAIDGAGMQNE